MTEQPRRAAGRTSRPRFIISLLLILAALASLGYVGWRVLEGDQPQELQPIAGTTASTQAARSKEATAEATQSAAAAKCTAVEAGFVPTRYTIDRIGVDERVLALNLDEQGNIAAPPKNESRVAAWWSGGPQPGAKRGQAILTIHTYRNGGAIGNQLFGDGQPALQQGDLLKLFGPKGQVQCYEYTSSTKIAVSDYDPSSDLMIDFQGRPRLAIVICWDFNPGTEIWDSRVFFHFTPVTVKA